MKKKSKHGEDLPPKVHRKRASRKDVSREDVSGRQSGEMTYGQRTAEARRARKRKRRIRSVLQLLTFVLTVSGLVALALSPLFQIRGVEVAGSTRYTKTELMGDIKPAIGDNAFKTLSSNLLGMLTFRYPEDERTIESTRSYVKSATVRYWLNGRIVIKILERVPACIAWLEDGYYIIDREGVVLEKADDPKALGLTVIKGLPYERLQPGQALGPGAASGLAAVRELMTAVEEADRENSYKFVTMLNYIDISDSKKITMMVDSRITVNLGSLNDIGYKLRFAREILQKNLTKGEKGVLDFTGGDNPRFIPG